MYQSSKNINGEAQNKATFTLSLSLSEKFRFLRKFFNVILIFFIAFCLLLVSCSNEVGRKSNTEENSGIDSEESGEDNTEGDLSEQIDTNAPNWVIGEWYYKDNPDYTVANVSEKALIYNPNECDDIFEFGKKYQNDYANQNSSSYSILSVAIVKKSEDIFKIKISKFFYDTEIIRYEYIKFVKYNSVVRYYISKNLTVDENYEPEYIDGKIILKSGDLNNPYVPVTGIIIANDTLDISNIGDKVQIEAKVAPKYATNRNIIFTSEDDNRAIVDNNGMATSLSILPCSIFCKTEDGGFEKKCLILPPSYLEFESDEEFSILSRSGNGGNRKKWDGILYYSTEYPSKSWQAWDGEKIFAKNDGIKFKLYIRGVDNTVIVGKDAGGGWEIEGVSVSCSGDIRSLLNYKNVENTTMSDYCFCSLFANNVSLISSPLLPATTLAQSCYSNMFSGCTSLTSAPTLSATTLAQSCYSNMFKNCISLTTPPKLPATTLAQSCYSNMFSGCTSLATSPALPATTLKEGCYSSMFRNCVNLLNVPLLPAKQGISGCYSSMFENCVMLKFSDSEDLENGYVNKITLASNMTGGDSDTIKNTSGKLKSVLNAKGLWTCNTIIGEGVEPTSINFTKPELILEYGDVEVLGIKMQPNQSLIPIEYTSSDDSIIKVDNYGRICAFGTGNATITARTENGLITTCDITVNNSTPNSIRALKFESDKEFTIRRFTDNDGVLLYATEFPTFDWKVMDKTLSAYSKMKGNKHFLYIRGLNNTKFYAWDIISSYYEYNRIIINGENVSCSGNILALLDYKNINSKKSLSKHCFAYLFCNNECLVSAPMLPSENISEGCYACMFEGCSSLIQASELPAKKLYKSCYSGMFLGCTSLTSAPTLPATTLAQSCYSGMFSGCTSLTSAPTLSATTLADYCYSNMFSGCTSLTSAPTLSATTLAQSCYSNMFSGCTSLTKPPALPATTLANGCYYRMFEGCTSLTKPPALPAKDLTKSCYESMFSGCTSLISVPKIQLRQASSIADNCFNSMFKNCLLLKFSLNFDETNGYINKVFYIYHINGKSYCNYMLDGTGGASTQIKYYGDYLWTSNEVVY